MSVPSPRGELSTSSVPSSAPTRSSSPRSPLPAARVRAADAVVAHLDHRAAVLAPRPRRARSVAPRVLGDVGQRLGDDEVGRGLDRARQPLAERAVELDRHRRAARQRLQRASSPRWESTAGMDAGREVAQLPDRRLRVGERAVDQLAARPPGSPAKRSRASCSSIISATSRCCAPSCRSRPSRRRSASPASTSRARDARSASSRARSSTSSRAFSSASAGGGARLDDAARASRSAPPRAASAPTRRPSWSISVSSRPAAARSRGPRGRRSRARAASRRRRASGRRARRRARRARRGRRRAARSARPTVAVRKKRVRSRPSRNAAGNSANERDERDLQPPWRRDVDRLRERGREPEHEHHRAEQQHRLQPAPLGAGRRPPAARAARRPGRRRRPPRGPPGPRPTTPATVASSAISNGLLGQSTPSQVENRTSSGCSAPAA